MSEASEQAAVIEWAEWHTKKYPCLTWLYHIPNGGHRHAAEAANLKWQGVKSGVSDLCLPYASNGYHGLYIEMKYGNNKPTESQSEFLQYVDGAGYKTAVCWTAEDAIEVIKEYILWEHTVVTHGI